jgi:Protein of unknown function (DUF2778)
MKYEWRSYPARSEYEALLLDTRAQRRGGAMALATVGLICAWTLGNHIAGQNSEPGFANENFVSRYSGEQESGKQDFVRRDIVKEDFADQGAAKADRADRPLDLADDVPTRGNKLAVVRSHLPHVNLAALFDPHAWGFVPGRFTQPQQADPQATASLPPAQGTAQVASLDAKPAVPLPTPSPLSRIRTALLHDAARATDKPAEPTIFERLFGKLAHPTTLAYASPDDAGLLAGTGGVTGRYDRQTAVYDITARMVYLPDGRALEAHSGYGAMLDDPRHADVRMRGVTPPTVYDLKEREASFHGVRAIRLIPDDESKVFGRSGLLAHTFMLGPNGDSNGCVSFRDYDAFLQAYLNGEIKRLVVVERL